MSKEFQPQQLSRDIIDTLALFLSGRIKKEDLSENDQALLGYYLGLMSDDRKFALKVNSRKNEIITRGFKASIFTSEELERIKKHKRGKNLVGEAYSQPALWNEVGEKSINDLSLENCLDPEKELSKLHKSASGRWGRHGVYGRLIREDVLGYRNKLRSEIGLPIARGKNPNVGNPVYKFLVRRVVLLDVFGIFGEHDRAMGEISGSLEARINQVKEMIGEVVEGNLPIREKFERFHRFVEDYRNEWEDKSDC